jgi:transposase
MAHPKTVRDAVRRDYIAQGMSPEVLGPMHGVSVASVIRWRRDARENGDDWDKHRAARRLSSGVPEDITRDLLMEFLEHHRHAMEQLRKAREGANGQAALSADDYASLLAKLQDGFNKMMAASKRMMPETDRLIVAAGVVEDLATFLTSKHPTLMAGFLDVLPEFQQLVEKKYG